MDTFHINRLKLAFIRTLIGTLTTKMHLNKAILGVHHIEEHSKCIDHFTSK